MCNGLSNLSVSASITNDLFHPDCALGNNPVCRLTDDYNEGVVPMIIDLKKDGILGRVIDPMAKAPECAKNIVRCASQSRVEIYTRFNENADLQLNLQDKGLELAVDASNSRSHLNDLFVASRSIVSCYSVASRWRKWLSLKYAWWYAPL